MASDGKWWQDMITGWWLTKTPLKNMSSSVGMMTFPTEWKVTFMFQATNQIKSCTSQFTISKIVNWYPTISYHNRLTRPSFHGFAPPRLRHSLGQVVSHSEVFDVGILASLLPMVKWKKMRQKGASVSLPWMFAPCCSEESSCSFALESLRTCNYVKPF